MIETKETAKISTAEIRKDIDDTEIEIRDLLRTQGALRAHLDVKFDKAMQLRCDAKPAQIQERREFVDKLKSLLDERLSK